MVNKCLNKKDFKSFPENSLKSIENNCTTTSHSSESEDEGILSMALEKIEDHANKNRNSNRSKSNINSSKLYLQGQSFCEASTSKAGLSTDSSPVLVSDDLGSTDEIKIFKDEGDREADKLSSENLFEEKSSLIHLTENEVGAYLNTKHLIINK